MYNITNNLDLTLSKVDRELRMLNVKESKTLMNTYCNLLSQFRRNFDCENVEDKSKLEIHRERLLKLREYSHQKISYYLTNSEYKDADNMAIITDRIELSIRSIDFMLSKERIILNFHINKK